MERDTEISSRITKASLKGVVALVIHEGIVPGPYLDSKKIWTFGVGHTAAAGEPNPVKMQRGMPKDLDAAIRYAVRVFSIDLAKYENAVAKALKIPVRQHEFDALVSFHYNTGAIARADLTKHLNRGNRRAAADSFMGWRKPPEVIARRRAEQHLFRSGVYPTGLIPVWGVTSAGKLTWRTVRTLTGKELISIITEQTQNA